MGTLNIPTTHIPPFVTEDERYEMRVHTASYAWAAAKSGQSRPLRNNERIIFHPLTIFLLWREKAVSSAGTVMRSRTAALMRPVNRECFCLDRQHMRHLQRTDRDL